jgi:hypothetical protein
MTFHFHLSYVQFLEHFKEAPIVPALLRRPCVVGGSTSSAEFPLQNPLVNQFEDSTTEWDLIVAEMSSDLSTLKFSSLLSSTQGVDAGSCFSALAVDSSNNLIVTGTTLSPQASRRQPAVLNRNCRRPTKM